MKTQIYNLLWTHSDYCGEHRSHPLVSHLCPTCFQASGKPNLWDHQKKNQHGHWWDNQDVAVWSARSITVGLRLYLRCVAETGSSTPLESSDPSMSWRREVRWGGGKKAQKSNPHNQNRWMFSGWFTSLKQLTLQSDEAVSTGASVNSRKGHECGQGQRQCQGGEGLFIWGATCSHHHSHKVKPYLKTHQILWKSRAAKGRCAWASWDHSLTRFVYIILLRDSLKSFCHTQILRFHFSKSQSRAPGNP